jgi:hypothetical protein
MLAFSGGLDWMDDENVEIVLETLRQLVLRDPISGNRYC